jgi:hypothetical protein
MGENIPVVIGVAVVVLVALAINPRTRPLVAALVNVVLFIPKLISFTANVVILGVVVVVVYFVVTNLPALTRMVDGVQALGNLVK